MWCIGNFGVGANEVSQNSSGPDGDSDHKPAAKELPEYLKQKLRARGILKDEPGKVDPVIFYANSPSFSFRPILSLFYSLETTPIMKLCVCLSMSWRDL